MRIGIVGNGSDKFTKLGRERAINCIYGLLIPEDILVSGHSPVGGIDIWSEEVALEIGAETDIKIPEINQWEPSGGYGFKARNLDIAKTSEVVFVVLADEYPAEYSGRRFKVCYHCNSTDHVKSGGCWTGKQALKFGTPAEWIIIKNA